MKRTLSACMFLGLLTWTACSPAADPLAFLDGAWQSNRAETLAELLDRAPHSLSRGQRLRVAVGAALACAPQVLLLDEPTAGQDDANVQAIMRLLRERKVELVFATHDLRLALAHADRAVVQTVIDLWYSGIADSRGHSGSGQ